MTTKSGTTFLVAVFALALSACAMGDEDEFLSENAQASGTPVSVTFGGGGDVTSEEVSILKGWLSADSVFRLELSLTELLTNGDTNDLGAQSVPLGNVEAVFSEKSEAIIDIPWSTSALGAGSAVFACSQVVIKSGSGATEFGENKCVSFEQP